MLAVCSFLLTAAYSFHLVSTTPFPQDYSLRVPRSHHTRHKATFTPEETVTDYQLQQPDPNSPYWSLLQSRLLPNINDPFAANSLLPFYFTRFPQAALLAQQRYLEETVTPGPEVTTTTHCDNECVADKIDVAVKSVDLLQAIVRVAPNEEKKEEKKSESGRFALRNAPLVAPFPLPLSPNEENFSNLRRSPLSPDRPTRFQQNSNDNCPPPPTGFTIKSKCSWTISPGQQLQITQSQPDLTICVTTVPSMSLCTTQCEATSQCQSVHWCRDCVDYNCRLLKYKANNNGFQLKPLITYVDYADKQFC